MTEQWLLEWKISRGINRCFAWKTQKLGLSSSLSDRFLGKVKGNGNQNHSQRHLEVGEGDGRFGSQFSSWCLQQFGRATPGHFPSEEGSRVALKDKMLLESHPPHLLGSKVLELLLSITTKPVCPTQ